MFYVILTVIGLTLGSFGHLLATRLLVEKDFVFTPSHCASCEKNLIIIDLIPVFSFCFLKGKCRFCQEKIPRSCLITEILTSGLLLLFVGVYQNYFLFILLFTALLLSVQDILAQVITFNLFLFSQSLVLVIYFLNGGMFHLASFTLILFLLFILKIILPQKMGLGDWLLLLVWSVMFHVEQILLLIIIACVAGIFPALFQKKIPFIPFLSIGLLVILIIDK